MLIQAHHQFCDGHTERIAQTEVSDQWVVWIKEIQKEYPVPPGAKWMVCTESSEHFVWLAGPGEKIEAIALADAEVTP